MVRAEVAPADTKQLAVPTFGRRHRPPAADVSFIGLAKHLYQPATPSAAAVPRGGEKCGLVGISRLLRRHDSFVVPTETTSPQWGVFGSFPNL